MASRFDRVELKARRTATGAIEDSPILTRTGIFEYRNPDGTTRREYRFPEAVFAPESLAAYKNLAITNGHPGKVTSKNVQSVLLGTVTSEGRRDGNDLRSDIIIHATSPVDGDGNKELSVGYDVEIDETPGTTPEGERYDVKQIKIVPNHLAIVKRGRAGNARLNMDASEEESASEIEPKKEAAMPKVRLDNGIEYDAAPEVIHALDKLRADGVKLEAERDTLKAAADKAAADLVAAKAETEKVRADAVVSAKARIELENRAKAVGVEVKADSTDRQLREAVIGKVRNDNADLSGKSDAYIEASYDLAIAQQGEQTHAAASQREAMGGKQQQQQGRGDAADEGGSGAARERYLASLRGETASK